MLKLLILIATFWTVYSKASVVNLEHQRALNVGEQVIHNLTIHDVLDKQDEDTYIVKARDDFNWVYAVKRIDLSVMDGCLEDVCVKDKMFDVDYLRFVSVRGITYHGKFLVESSEGWSGLYMIQRKSLAATSGCSEYLERKYCVGNVVKDLMGNKLAIIAIHADGKLVLRSIDGWNSYRSYIEAGSITLIN